MSRLHTLLLLPLPLLALVLIHPALGQNLFTAECQASSASPWSQDCIEAIDTLDCGQRCYQTNSHQYGSRCQTMHQVGGCKLAICGAAGQSMASGTVRSYLRDIAFFCGGCPTSACDGSVPGVRVGGQSAYMHPDDDDTESSTKLYVIIY